MNRKNWTFEEKLSIVLEILKGDCPVKRSCTGRSVLLCYLVYFVVFVHWIIYF